MWGNGSQQQKHCVGPRETVPIGMPKQRQVIKNDRFGERSGKGKETEQTGSQESTYRASSIYSKKKIMKDRNKTDTDGKEPKNMQKTCEKHAKNMRRTLTVVQEDKKRESKSGTERERCSSYVSLPDPPAQI